MVRTGGALAVITSPVLAACRVTSMQQVVQELTLMRLKWDVQTLKSSMRMLVGAVRMLAGLRGVGVMGRWALQGGGWGRNRRHDGKRPNPEWLMRAVCLLVLSRVLSRCLAGSM